MFFRSLIWCLRNLHFVCSQISFFDHFLILWFCIDLVMPFRCCVCHAAQWFACLDLAFGMCYLGWKPPENWENSMGERWDPPSSARSIACLPEVEKSAVDWFLTEDMSRWVDQVAVSKWRNFSGWTFSRDPIDSQLTGALASNPGLWQLKGENKYQNMKQFIGFFSALSKLKGWDVSQVGIEFKISMDILDLSKKTMAPFEVAIARTAVNRKWKSSSLNDHQWRSRHAKT